MDYQEQALKSAMQEHPGGTGPVKCLKQKLVSLQDDWSTTTRCPVLI